MVIKCKFLLGVGVWDYVVINVGDYCDFVFWMFYGVIFNSGWVG